MGWTEIVKKLLTFVVGFGMILFAAENGGEEYLEMEQKVSRVRTSKNKKS